jgi:hypothetical protein
VCVSPRKQENDEKGNSAFCIYNCDNCFGYGDCEKYEIQLKYGQETKVRLDKHRYHFHNHNYNYNAANSLFFVLPFDERFPYINGKSKSKTGLTGPYKTGLMGISTQLPFDECFPYIPYINGNKG